MTTSRPPKPDIAHLKDAERAERRAFRKAMALTPLQYRLWRKFKRQLEKLGL